ncbi:hypothetical protein V6N13_013858 [Hibiscus sabdariffa]
MLKVHVSFAATFGNGMVDAVAKVPAFLLSSGFTVGRACYRICFPLVLCIVLSLALAVLVCILGPVFETLALSQFHLF